MPKTVSIAPDVAAVLARCTSTDNILFLPPGQLDKALYAKVDKVLTTIGGKWNRHAGGHVFAGGFGDQLADALAAGEVVDVKKTHEQFFTPVDLAARMVEMLDVQAHELALEPSAGNGRIAARLLMAKADVLAVEIDPQHIPALEGLRGPGLGNISVSIGDFMALPYIPAGGVLGRPAPAVVAMNPPFSRNQDIAHVRRAFDMLAHGGRLVSVMSPHWLFSDDQASREFRAWTRIDGLPQFSLGVTTYPRTEIAEARVQHLPAKTFAESGTTVSTVLLMLKKEG